MMKLFRLLSALPVCAGLAVFSATASAQMGMAQPNAQCQLKMEARLPMVENGGHYMVPVDINDRSYLMAVDTGAGQTALMPSAANMLGLGTDTSVAQRVVGIGTTAWSEYARIVPSLRLGTSEWINLKVLTADMLPARLQTMMPPPIGLLGADVLSRYDVEFDFPARQMTLYTAQHCFGWFVPWQGRYYQYQPGPGLARQHLFLLPVMLNGHPAQAMLDTGASRSLVTRRTAFGAGVGEAALNQLYTASGTGFGGGAVVTRNYRFDSFQVGPNVFRRVPMAVGDTDLTTGDMLLGMDFMRSRRVWVSYSSNLVFIQSARPGLSDVIRQAAPAQPAPIRPIPSQVVPAAIPAPAPASSPATTVPALSVDAKTMQTTQVKKEKSLRQLLAQRPDLSTHTHITYFTGVRVEQRGALQLEPMP